MVKNRVSKLPPESAIRLKTDRKILFTIQHLKYLKESRENEVINLCAQLWVLKYECFLLMNNKKIVDFKKL